MSLRKAEPGEEVLTRADEKWWRQCPDTADCWDPDNERPSALMFRWDDTGELSGAREDGSTAAQAYDHRVNVEKKGSKGTWAVKVGTVTGMSMQLIDDTANLPEPPKSPPGHAYFDARDVSRAKSKAGRDERERVRSKLFRAAMRLGKQHPVDEVGAASTADTENVSAASTTTTSATLNPPDAAEGDDAAS